MNNESSIAKIYWTEDYGQFHFLHGNRDLVESKINKLSRDVEAGLNLFQYCPILVNKDFFIIDGQHRFYVCKSKKLKVYYCVVPDFTLAQIAKLNNNQNRWTNNDFLNCYIDAGRNSGHYKTLKNFIGSYGVTLSEAVSLLYAGIPANGGRFLELFRDGDFEVRFLNEATQLCDLAGEYSEFTDANYSRNFLATLQKLLAGDKFSHREMIQKLQKNNLRIEKRSNVKEYLVHMEELFNFKNSIRKTIY